jgi:hypothetical protein
MSLLFLLLQVEIRPDATHIVEARMPGQTETGIGHEACQKATTRL